MKPCRPGSFESPRHVALVEHRPSVGESFAHLALDCLPSRRGSLLTRAFQLRHQRTALCFCRADLSREQSDVVDDKHLDAALVDAAVVGTFASSDEDNITTPHNTRAERVGDRMRHPLIHVAAWCRLFHLTVARILVSSTGRPL